MDDNHSLGFRPSHFGDLAKCIHHERKEGEIPSEALLRGIEIHKSIAMFMDEDRDPADCPEQTPPIKFAMATIWDLMVQGWKIFAIEQPVDILEDFDVITQGTIDLVLERDGEFLIIDWKTGDRGDYDLQMFSYISAWMDRYPSSKNITCKTVYVDLKEIQTSDLPYETVSSAVIALYNRWIEKEKEPYVIGNQCHWCALRPTCPAWIKSAENAFDQVLGLALNSETPLPQRGNLGQAEIDHLKNNPRALETFLICWERAKTLVEDDWGLKGVLRSHIETGYKSEYFSLVSIKPRIEKSIDPEQFLERIARKIGFMKAGQLIKVDAEKTIEAWTDWTSDPLPVKVEETEKPGYSYVRQKGKPHAGESRRKQKELL